ncbi:MAG TPA: hypothetical protein H9887_08370 [Candidatus Dorea intestinavium]|nr:hypothetical protein [Candidatus Dorea intestinavium]
MKRNKKSFLSFLLAFVMVLNMLMPSLSVVAQEDTSTAEAAQKTEETQQEVEQMPENEQLPKDDVAISENQDGTADDVAISENQEATADDSKIGIFDVDQRDPQEVGNLIGNLETIIKDKNGNDVDKITAGEPFWLEGSFTIPAPGDEGVTDWVINGDWVDELLPFETGIELFNDPSVEIMHDGEKIGTLTFDKTNSRVSIKFDGDSLDEHASNIKCSFGAKFTYHEDETWEEGETKVVSIFGKDMNVTKPKIKVDKTIEKSGKESKDHPGEVEWSVKVNAKKNGAEVSLKDYVFSDDLTEVGDFVPGSFKVNNVTKDNSVYNSAKKTLNYTFEDVSGEQIVTFRTKIPEQMLIPGGSIDNTAYFGDDDEIVPDDGTAEISKKTLITKDGEAYNWVTSGVYDPKKQTITWTITVDPNGLDLTNVKVTDKLSDKPAKWTWLSAKWEWDSTAQSGITLPAITSEPTGGVYNLNNGTTPLKEKVKLTIVTKVPAETHPGHVFTYKNKATITSDQVPKGQDSNEKGVGIGITSIKKAAGQVDYEKRQIPWTVTVDLKKQDTFTEPENLKVYDLLIYGKEGSFKAGSSNLADLTSTTIAKKLTPKYSQQYVDGSFANEVGLTVDVKKVTQNGKEVGDLLIVSGFDADKAYPYTFKTQVLDPNIFAGNKNQEVQNTATLFYGDEYLHNATGKTNYERKVLSKEIMNAAGNGIGNAGNGFNYEDRTAVFRLNVNEDQVDLTGADIYNGGFTTMGEITVVDTLPEGWSFVDLAEGVKYELHKADGTLVTDVSGIIDGTPAITDQTATFVFSKLDTSYYILVKAQLSEEKYLEYGRTEETSKNGSVKKTNKVSMNSEGDKDWKPTGKHDVRVNTKFLDKELLSPGDDSSALPKWTIKYHPYGLESLKKITIKDKLPEGLSLKLNKDGSLAADAVIITEYTDPGDGTFPSTGGTVVDIKPSYDPNTRELSVALRDDKKLYKIEYETLVSADVKGDANLKNQVTAEGKDDFTNKVEKSWIVSKNWAKGKIERVGLLQIEKTKANGKPLAGAEFGLFNNATDENPIFVATSNEKGIASIRGIPAPKTEGEVWDYYLKETKAPSNDYLMDPTIYHVTVQLGEVSPGKVRPIVLIEGNPATYEEGNKMFLTNFKEDEVGDLTLKKLVKDGEEGRTFKFTITMDNKDVKGKTFAAKGVLSSVHFDNEGKAEITLKDKESVTIKNLPKEAKYTILEEDYSAEYKAQVAVNGEVTEGSQATGTILAQNEQKVEFTNTRRLGDLLIKKTVKDSEEKDRVFEFTITLDQEKLQGQEQTFKAEGAVNSVTFDTEGKAVLNLKAGEFVKIINIPQDMAYTVTEADYSTGYHTQVALNEAAATDGNTVQGQISDEKVQNVEFINSRNLGDLTLSKTVKDSEEKDREFKFTIALNNENLLGEAHTYAAEGAVDSVTFDAKGEAVLKLKADERVTIKGIPQGTGYTVTEADYSEGYKSQVAVNGEAASDGKTATGEILTNATQSVDFTNTRRLGNIMIKKDVLDSEEKDRAFEFTITLDNENLLGEEHTFSAEGAVASVTFDAEGKAVLNLKDKEYVQILNLPQGTGYTVTEADYSEGYKSEVSTNGEEAVVDNTTAGEILAEETQNIAFTNHRRLGNLTLSKTVKDGEEKDRAFEFTITLDNENLLGEEHTFNAEGAVASVTFDAEGKAVLNLKNKETVTILNLPQGTGYTVTEADYSDGYKTDVSANEEEAIAENTATGEILAEETQSADFTNHRRLGNLTISKVVKDGEEKGREFEFNITLDNKNLEGEEHTYKAEGAVKSVTFDSDAKATLKLKADETVTILGIPEGTGYTVTEADYSKSYQTEVSVNKEEAVASNQGTGEILAEETQSVDFTNSRRLGNLTLSKAVKDSEEKDRAFEFTITLDNKNLQGEKHTYQAEGKVTEVTFNTKGEAVLNLKADESVTILDLPEGTGYTVTEADYSDGYKTQVAVNGKKALSENTTTGEILAEETQSVAFTNTRKLGDLTLTKLVKKGNNKEAFEFTITLDNENLKGENHTYQAEGKADTVTFDKAGKATIKLKNGESLTIRDLPQGTKYTVTEANYSENYTTQVALNEGKQENQRTITGNITDKEIQKVLFTNTGIDKNHAKVVKTGDNSRHTLVVGIIALLLSLAVIVSLVVRRRKIK